MKDKKNIIIIGIVAIIILVAGSAFAFNQYGGGNAGEIEESTVETSVTSEPSIVITPSSGFTELLSFVSDGIDYTLGPIPGHFWNMDSDTTLLAEHYSGSEPFPWASDVSADTLLYEVDGIVGTCANGYAIDKPAEDGFVHFHGSNEDSNVGFWLKHTAVVPFTFEGPPGNPDIGRSVPLGIDSLFPNICEFPSESQEISQKIDTETLGAIDGVVEVEMSAKQWEFSPKEVRVKQGDRVKMTLTSLDVTHGFAINEFGVNETIPAGETVTFEFVADKKGTYRQYCSIVCGIGHSGMVGEFIVE